LNTTAREQGNRTIVLYTVGITRFKDWENYECPNKEAKLCNAVIGYTDDEVAHIELQHSFQESWAKSCPYQEILNI